MNQHTQFTLYATPPHHCSYFPEREATTIFVDPDFPRDKTLYTTLSRHGFRRSGEHLYRPHCQTCELCIPVRVPVRRFSPNRTQKRVWRANQDLNITAHTGELKQEHFDLYCHYLDARHKGGGMDNPSVASCRQFLMSDWANTVFYEFRLHEQLLAVGVVDVLNDGLSAVYTFFDPQHSKRSLGVYVVLWEIAHATSSHLDWLYLGYWIEGCRKMSYKIQYQPLEYYRLGRWQRDEGQLENINKI
ncbi:arginyltransferase [Thioflexithrix psekupsensis]|uniref:Aspartate/glutamate leucyltransferase n=1 Tax=Thioflexithrix psekupsensis TaxID=1570016 RepID=A0A251X4Y5_9GAMM|nr:arginyltransferase [Thioflexithrix psekupsensis]OUD11997.1 arginyltransferase [Thioflexithrix psekupsensis]